MTKDGKLIWLGLAAVALLWAMPGLASGTVPWLPLLACGLALACAAHAPSRNLVIEKTCAFVAARPHRWLLILFGAGLLWQLVGVELAILIAGDVLVYVEVLTAVTLMSANARLAPVREAVRRKVETVVAKVTVVARTVARSARAIRIRRPSTMRSDDGEGAGWAVFA